jgi:hypothetical protein
MRDLVELVVAGLAAVAVNVVLGVALLLGSTLVPALRDALGTVHEAYCRVVGGGYGFAGRSRPRRRPPVSSPSSPPDGSRWPASSRSART